MTPLAKIEARVRQSIDSITESLRINNAETDTTEFLLNYLTGNLAEIADLILEQECDKATDESSDSET